MVAIRAARIGGLPLSNVMGRRSMGREWQSAGVLYRSVVVECCLFGCALAGRVGERHIPVTQFAVSHAWLGRNLEASSGGHAKQHDTWRPSVSSAHPLRRTRQSSPTPSLSHPPRPRRLAAWRRRRRRRGLGGSSPESRAVIGLVVALRGGAGSRTSARLADTNFETLWGCGGADVGRTPGRETGQCYPPAPPQG